MKLIKKLGAVLGAMLATVGGAFAADPTNATEVISSLQSTATGYISAGVSAVAVVVAAMFGILAVMVVARWIKRAFAGR